MEGENICGIKSIFLCNREIRKSYSGMIGCDNMDVINTVLLRKLDQDRRIIRSESERNSFRTHCFNRIAMIKSALRKKRFEVSKQRMDSLLIRNR